LTVTTRLCTGGSSCFLSTLATYGASLTVDPAGNAYIAGTTFGHGLPATPGAFLTDGAGAFAAKVNSAGTGMVYVTSLDGPTTNGTKTAAASSAFAIAADSAGNAYLAGSTSHPSFPATPSAFQTKLALANPPANALAASLTNSFVVKLNPAGSALVWASYLGGRSVDQAQTIALDSAGNVWVSGIASSTDSPASSGFPDGGDFLVEFNPSGSALVNSVRYPSSSVGASLAVDFNGLVHTPGTNGLVSIFTPIQLAAPANLWGRERWGQPVERPPCKSDRLHRLRDIRFSGFLPTTLAGTKVFINGIAAPRLYVSGTQINVVAPLELTTASFPTLQVSFTNVFILGFRLAVDPAQPQVFRHPDGSAAAINQDDTVNSKDNPAKVGDFVSIWATGVGFTQGVDGQMQTAADSLRLFHP
jgi:hypothetical protein